MVNINNYFLPFVPSVPCLMTPRCRSTKDTKRLILAWLRKEEARHSTEWVTDARILGPWALWVGGWVGVGEFQRAGLLPCL